MNIREPHPDELALFGGDYSAALVDIAFRSGAGPLSVDECRQYAQLAVDVLRAAGLLLEEVATS